MTWNNLIFQYDGMPQELADMQKILGKASRSEQMLSHVVYSTRSLQRSINKNQRFLKAFDTDDGTGKILSIPQIITKPKPAIYYQPVYTDESCTDMVKQLKNSIRKRDYIQFITRSGKKRNDALSAKPFFQTEYARAVTWKDGERKGKDIDIPKDVSPALNLYMFGLSKPLVVSNIAQDIYHYKDSRVKIQHPSLKQNSSLLFVHFETGGSPEIIKKQAVQMGFDVKNALPNDVYTKMIIGESVTTPVYKKRNML